MGEKTQICRWCKSEVPKGATFCRYCTRALDTRRGEVEVRIRREVSLGMSIAFGFFLMVVVLGVVVLIGMGALGLQLAP